MFPNSSLETTEVLSLVVGTETVALTNGLVDASAFIILIVSVLVDVP